MRTSPQRDESLHSKYIRERCDSRADIFQITKGVHGILKWTKDCTYDFDDSKIIKFMRLLSGIGCSIFESWQDNRILVFETSEHRGSLETKESGKSSKHAGEYSSNLKNFTIGVSLKSSTLSSERSS